MSSIFDVLEGGCIIVHGDEDTQEIVAWNQGHMLYLWYVSLSDEEYIEQDVWTLPATPTLPVARKLASMWHERDKVNWETVRW
jgi:hypothetical protein